MHDLISRLLAWARAVPRPDGSGTGPNTRTTAGTTQVTAPCPYPPLTLRAPRLPDWPMDNGRNPEYMLWVTAHGIDIRHRQPHSGEAHR